MSHTHTDISIYIFQASLGWYEEKDGGWTRKMIVVRNYLSHQLLGQLSKQTQEGFCLALFQPIWFEHGSFLLANSF